MKKVMPILIFCTILSLILSLPLNASAASNAFKRYCSPAYNKGCGGGGIYYPPPAPTPPPVPKTTVAVVTPTQPISPTPAIATKSTTIQQGGLFDRLAGRIVLRVEKNGEAYYVNPITHGLDYLGKPQDAFQVMKKTGIGAHTSSLEQIPLGLLAHTGKDQDKDGLVDIFEQAIGTDKTKPDSDVDGYKDWEEILGQYSPSKPLVRQPINISFASLQAGKIFLQVEDNGEAWYVYPGDNKRYYLARPHDALTIMKTLGLGISEKDYEELIKQAQ